MGPKTFNKIVDSVYPIRNMLYQPNGNWPFVDFDFPNYGGLPKKILRGLSSEAVDAMQQTLPKKVSRKRDFARNYKSKLIELGERIRF